MCWCVDLCGVFWVEWTPLLLLWSRGQSQVTYARKKFYRWSTGTTIDFQYMDLTSLSPSSERQRWHILGRVCLSEQSLSFLEVVFKCITTTGSIYYGGGITGGGRISPQPPPYYRTVAVVSVLEKMRLDMSK